MVVTLFSPELLNEEGSSMAGIYRLEINGIMCLLESFLYINKIPFAYSQITISRSKMTAYIVIKHPKFIEIDSIWSNYVIDFIRDAIEINILLTVQDGNVKE